MQNLLIVSIGPVQDFIAAARRSRDLWFGSWLLSELSKEAALSLSEQGGELVFPSPQKDKDRDLKPGSDFSVANKITAIIDGEPARIASEVEVRVRRRLRDLMQEAFKAVKGEFYKEKAEEQVEDMLEIFAASVPMGDYKDALEKANSLLAARKNTRDFQPVTWGAPVPKSSLDGQRESVIPEEKYNELSPENLRKKYGVAPAERLCGVGLLKRHGAKSRQEEFFSTSHVAALSLAEAFKPEHKEAFNRYVSELEALGVDDLPTLSVKHEVFGRYDLSILFEERLHEFLEKEQLSKAKKSLGDFLKSTVNKRPIPYYAILQADGDRMGELLDKESTKEMHQKISERLSDFAEDADEIVDEHRGSLIYAGGDDVLAMLPLHTVLECVYELAEKFAERLKDLSSIKPSLSAGIAVCHHVDPMYEALRLVRNAEKIAKSVDGKDALAITVSKRSGVDVTVKGKRKDLVKHLETLIEYHRSDEIPDGFAYELRTLKSQFKEFKERSKSSERSESSEIIKYEAIRILGRKRRKRGSEDVDIEVQKYLRQYVEQDLELELIVARLFAEAYELAYGKGKSNVLGD